MHMESDDDSDDESMGSRSRSPSPSREAAGVHFMDVLIPRETMNALSDSERARLLDTVRSHESGDTNTFQALVEMDALLHATLSRKPELGPFHASFKTALKNKYQKYAANEYYWISAENTSIMLLGGVGIKDFALPWDGVGSSSTDVSPGSLFDGSLGLMDDEVNANAIHLQCIICQSAFDGEIRTLVQCAHTFCAGCILPVMQAAERLGQEPRCPTCRAEFVPVFGDPSAIEDKYNKLLLRAHDQERRYKCPVDGCKETFNKADLAVHMNRCGRRKVICDAGCNQQIQLRDKHSDCGRFWHSRWVEAQKTIENIRKEEKRFMEWMEGSMVEYDGEGDGAGQQEEEEDGRGGAGQRSRKRPVRYRDDD